MKITQSELNTLAESIAKSTGSRSGLVMDKLRKAAEAKGFDTPGNSALSKALDAVLEKAISSMAEGEAKGMVSQSAAVKASKGDYRVHHSTVSDVGSAKAHAVAAYELNRYCNGIKREGKNALSTKLRQKVIDLFNALVDSDKAQLPLETVSLANRFTANAEKVEAECVAHFEAEQAKRREKAEKEDALRQAKIDAAARSLVAARDAKGKKVKTTTAKDILDAAKTNSPLPAVTAA